MKIKIGSDTDPDTTIHTNGRDVTIREAFIGPLFTTDTGETLGVCMRDSGYEITYQAPGQPEMWLSLNCGRIGLFAPTVDELCEVMHDAYEAAAATTGWETQEASRKPWADVPEANKATMRTAVEALLDRVFDEQTRAVPDEYRTVDG